MPKYVFLRQDPLSFGHVAVVQFLFLPLILLNVEWDASHFVGLGVVVLLPTVLLELERKLKWSNAFLRGACRIGQAAGIVVLLALLAVTYGARTTAGNEWAAARELSSTVCRELSSNRSESVWPRMQPALQKQWDGEALANAARRLSEMTATSVAREAMFRQRPDDGFEGSCEFDGSQASVYVGIAPADLLLDRLEIALPAPTDGE